MRGKTVLSVKFCMSILLLADALTEILTGCQLECFAEAVLLQGLRGVGPLVAVMLGRQIVPSSQRKRQLRRLMGIIFLRRALSWKLEPFEQTASSL